MTRAAPEPASPLFVELSGSGFRHVFEFEASNDRAFLVGSSRQADFCIGREGIAAVEFHVERLGSDIWLVPAYRGRDLRVNGTPMRSSVKVDGRLLLSLGALEVELRVLPDDADIDETSRSSSAPRPLPANYVQTLPTDTACTRVAMKPFELDPSASVPTQQTPIVGGAPRAPLAAQQTQRIEPIRPAPLPTLQHTERLAPVTMAPRPGIHESTAAVFRTQRIAPLTAAPPPVATHEIRPIVQPAAQMREPARAAEPTPLTTQETTAFDVAALAVEPHAVLSHASEASATAPQANEPPKHAAPPPRSPVHEFLTKLGILTTERPVLIGGGSLVGAFVLALALVGATRVAEPARKAAALAASASAKPTTRPITAATPSPSSVKLEPIITAVKPPPIEAKSTARAQKGITDPALTAAVGHLAAGRVAEASASYRSLSSRSEGGDVYATVSSLLAQRTASCAAGPAQLNHCPEILK